MRKKMFIAVVAICICITFALAFSKSMVSSSSSAIVSSSAKFPDNSKKTDSSDLSIEANEDASDLTQLAAKAESLTLHIVNYALPFGSESGYESLAELLNEEHGNVIYHFVVSQFLFFEDENDPYHELFDSKEFMTDTTVFMPLPEVQTMVKEVFGVSDWFENPDNAFDFNTQCFQFPTEIGIQQYYSAEIIKTYQTGKDTITVLIELKDSNLVGDVSQMDYGRYAINYEFVNNSGHPTFLLQSVSKR